jgi:hypothetical protein
MVRVIKRKLHGQKARDWDEASSAERLEAVETISGIRKGQDAQSAFSRVHRVIRKK